MVPLGIGLCWELRCLIKSSRTSCAAHLCSGGVRFIAACALLLTEHTREHREGLRMQWESGAAHVNDVMCLLN